ncbi:MAG: sortase [Chloroflexi bacterium]|nr:sortase [Chloroflexota bacterium]
MSRLSSALMVIGLCLAVGGVLWQLGVWPGSETTLPRPVALDNAPAPLPTATLAATARVEPTPPPRATPTPRPAPTPFPTPTSVVVPTPAPIHVLVADAGDRAAWTPETPTGYAVRLVIPSINLDTPVVQGGIVQDDQGNSTWQTLPFVAVHYGDLTSLLGAPGNAVISGHVVTINEGNVFRFLYQVGIDDLVQVWDEQDREYDYHVADVKLVLPSDVSVMAPTPDQTLTLITCGGSFDRVHREFSERLIVTAKPGDQ